MPAHSLHTTTTTALPSIRMTDATAKANQVANAMIRPSPDSLHLPITTIRMQHRLITATITALHLPPIPVLHLPRIPALALPRIPALHLPRIPARIPVLHLPRIPVLHLPVPSS